MNNRFAHLEDLVEQQSITFSLNLFAVKRNVRELDKRIQNNALVIDYAGLSVNQGMISQDVTKLLEDEQITKNAIEFK